MKQQPQSNPRDSHDSTPNQAAQSYQTEQFQIQSGTITHRQITNMIEKWDTFSRIRQKFGSWSLNFPYQKLLKIAPQQFYKTAIHYVFLRKLSILIKDFDQTQILKKSLQVKEIYKIMLLKGRLKGRRFDNLLLVTVKLIGFFFASHTSETIITKELQSQMYAILVFVLLGTQVGQRAYFVLIQKYKKKPSLKYDRCSQTPKFVIPPYEVKKVTEQRSRRKATKLTTFSKKRLGRTICRTSTQMFYETVKEVVAQQLREMKQQLKTNLVVKEFIPQPKPKQTLDELLQKEVQTRMKLNQLKEVSSMQKKQMKQKKIFYTQMSSSLDLKRDCESLNMLKNHSLKIRPQKESMFYQLLKQKDIVKEKKKEQKVQQLKLPIIQKPKQMQTQSYHAMMLKKKQPTYWKKVVTGMKENRFEHIQHFPLVAHKMYRDVEENIKKRMSMDESIVGSSQPPMKDQNFHGEYITENHADTERNPPPMQLKLPKIPSVCSMQKKPSFQEKNILKETKQHINIVDYSRVSNDSQIYKSDKGFINVYSNHPLDNQKSILKRKSYHQLKEMERRFYQDCKVRHQLIRNSYLS